MYIVPDSSINVCPCPYLDVQIYLQLLMFQSTEIQQNMRKIVCCDEMKGSDNENKTHRTFVYFSEKNAFGREGIDPVFF